MACCVTRSPRISRANHITTIRVTLIIYTKPTCNTRHVAHMKITLRPGMRVYTTEKYMADAPEVPKNKTNHTNADMTRGTHTFMYTQTLLLPSINAHYYWRAWYEHRQRRCDQTYVHSCTRLRNHRISHLCATLCRKDARARISASTKPSPITQYSPGTTTHILTQVCCMFDTKIFSNKCDLGMLLTSYGPVEQKLIIS